MKSWLTCLAVLLLAGSCFAYTIEGMALAEESAGVRIYVTPHTSSSPVNNFEQSFSFENQGSSLEGVRAVYYFPEQPDITVEEWTEPVYQTVEYSQGFDDQLYDWEIVETGDATNPYKATVWQNVSDANGMNESTVAWERRVKESRPCEQPEKTCFYWEEETLVGGNTWQDASQKFHLLGQADIGGKSVFYYYSDEFDLAAGQKKDWRIKYGASADSGKWTLALVKGETGCLEDNGCESQLVLDPWWETGSWNYRKKITLKTSDFLGSDISNDHVILVRVGPDQEDFWSHVDPTGKDVRFTSADSLTELKFYLQKWDYASKEMLAWARVTDTFTATADTELYLYYGNSEAIDAQDPQNTLSSFEAVYHADEGTGSTVSDQKGEFDVIVPNEIWDSENAWLGDSALGIDGTHLARQETLLDSIPSNLSVSMWIRPTFTIDDSTSFGTHQHLFNKVNGYGEAFGVYFHAVYRGYFSYGAHTNGKVNGFNSNTRTWEGGTWYHMIFTWNTTNGIEAWSNSVLEGSNGNATTTMVDGSYLDFFIGSNNLRSDKFYGVIDEFKVFNVGLNSEEAKLLYHSEKGDLVEISEEELGDLDGDGVPDGIDQCLGTPLGEAVDAVGCSCSQKVCDDGNPCTNDSCDWNSAACLFENDNSNQCGFERDCPNNSCILRQEPPYFYWNIYPEDSHDYCLEGSCQQYSCGPISEDFNAECSFADTSEVEAKVEELEGKVAQLEQQNLELQGKISLLEASVNAVQQVLENFVSIIDSYLFALPRGLRQGMICGALEQSGDPSAEGFGLYCEMNERAQCQCQDA